MSRGHGGIARGAAAVVLGILLACGDSKPPVVPSPPGPGGDPVVMRIDIEGPGEIAPGTEAQFVVKAQYSNGGLLDVTLRPSSR